MPRSVDWSPLPLTHDPTQSLEFHVRQGIARGVEMWQIILDAIRDHAEQLVREVIQKLLGFVADPGQALEDLFAELGSWAGEIPGIGPLAEALTGMAGAQLSDVASHFNKLWAGLQGIDLSGDPGAVLRAIMTAVLGWVKNLRPEWLPLIDLGSIGRLASNMVAENGFTEQKTIASGLRWVWDGTDGAPDPDTGDPSVGCARFPCDGTDNPLSSQVPIPVRQGEELDVGQMVRRESVTAAAGALRLELVSRYRGAVVSTVTIADMDPSGSADWAPMSGTWIVPAGVDEVVPQPRVTDAATAGIIKVDRVWVKKIQRLDMDFTKNLVKRWEQIAAFAGVTDTDLDGDIDVIDVWNSLWSGRLKGLNWIPNATQATIDWINAGFASANELLDEGLDQTIVGGVISELLGQGTRNASLVAKHEARLRAIESAGNALTDDFERGASSSPGGLWTPYHSSGGGSGGPGTDGKGNLVYKPSGISNRIAVVRHTGAITTDACKLVVLLSSTPPSTWPDDAYSYAGFSAHAGSVTYGRLRIGGASVHLQAMAAGTAYDLVTWNIDCKAAHQLELQRGEAGGVNMHTYRLWLNGVQVGDPWTDPNARLPYGAGYRSMVAGMETSLRVGLIPSQWIPAGFAYLQLQEVI